MKDIDKMMTDDLSSVNIMEGVDTITLELSLDDYIYVSTLLDMGATLLSEKLIGEETAEKLKKVHKSFTRQCEAYINNRES